MGQNTIRKAIKPVLVAIILLAFSSGAWLLNDGFLSERIYQQQTHERAEDYAARARIAVERTCLPLPPSKELECVRQENKTAREGAYNENDLKAQLVTSVWTRQMGIAAIIAMAFGILGVGLVYVTFSATREANDIARDAQRAWVTLKMEPRLVRRDGQGLYFHINFTAENVGDTVATHFDFLTQAFFRGQHEKILSFANRVEQQVEDWKSEHEMHGSSCIVPKDIQLDRFVDHRQPPEVKWWKGVHPSGVDVTQIVFLAAVFYRTVSHPDIVQLSWRSWYLFSFDEKGNVASFIPRPTDDFGPNDLFAEPFRTSVRHEEYAATEREWQPDAEPEHPVSPSLAGAPRKQRVRG